MVFSLKGPIKLGSLLGLFCLGWVHASFAVVFAGGPGRPFTEETTSLLAGQFSGNSDLRGASRLLALPTLPPNDFTAIQFDQLIQQINLLNQNLVELNGNWESTNHEVAAANSHWAETLKQVDAFDENWKNSLRQVSGINQNWANSNDLLKALLDPVHGLELGASLGAGFVLGSAGTSLALQGVKFGVSALYEAITHEKRDAKILEAMAEARENYPKLVQTIAKLESQIHSAFFIELQVQRAGGRFQLNWELQNTISKLDILVRGLNELGQNLNKLKKFRESQQLLAPYAASQEQLIDYFFDTPVAKAMAKRESQVEEGNSIDRTLQIIESMLSQAQAESEQALRLKVLLHDYSEANMCEFLLTGVDDLIQGEKLLQETRLVLTRALHRQVWEKDWSKREQRNLKNSEALQNEKEFKKLRKAQKALAKSFIENVIEHDPELKSKVYESYYRCLQENGVGVASYSYVRKLAPLTHRDVAKVCWKEAMDPTSNYTREYSSRLEALIEGERNLKVGLIEEDQIRTQTITANPLLAALALRSERERFLQLERDQVLSRTELRLEVLKEKKREVENLCGLKWNEGEVRSPLLFTESTDH